MTSIQDALLKDPEVGRSLSDNTDHAAEIPCFCCNFSHVFLKSSINKYICRNPWTYNNEDRETGCWCIGEELFTVIWTLKTPLCGHVKSFLQGWALLPVLLQVLGHLVHLGPQVIPAKTDADVKEMKETTPFFS